MAPPTLVPVGVETWPCRVSYHLDPVLADEQPDAVMMLRVQRERMGAGAAGGGYFPTPLEYTRGYGLDGRRLGLLPDHAIVMHPGPMNRGLEISADAADSRARGHRRAGGERGRGPDGGALPAARRRGRPRPEPVRPPDQTARQLHQKNARNDERTGIA